MKIRKNIQFLYQKNVAKKTSWFVINRKKGKEHYVLIKNFNTFMYNHTFHHGKKHFVVIACKLLVQKNIEMSC